jgi:hypothetical protein
VTRTITATSIKTSRAACISPVRALDASFLDEFEVLAAFEDEVVADVLAATSASASPGMLNDLAERLADHAHRLAFEVVEVLLVGPVDHADLLHRVGGPDSVASMSGA